MKTTLKPFIFALLLLCFMAVVQISVAQSPPPPPGDKGSSTNQNPMGAPIDGGLTIFLAFAAAYSGREWAKSRGNKRETAED